MATDSEIKELEELKHMGIGEITKREKEKEIKQKEIENKKYINSKNLYIKGKRLKNLERQLGKLPSPRTLVLPIQTRSSKIIEKLAGKLKKYTKKNKRSHKKYIRKNKRSHKKYIRKKFNFK